LARYGLLLVYKKSSNFPDAHTSSAVFRDVRRIPEDLLRTDLSALPLERKRLAFEREAARSHGRQQTEVPLGYLRMLRDAGDEAGAREVFNRIDPVWYGHPSTSSGSPGVPDSYRAAA
jgi:hypothetical protein